MNNLVEDFERFYRDNNDKITPIRHPDLSTQPNILPQKFSSNYIFEQILFMGSDIKGNEFVLKLPFNPDISNPMVISSSVFSNSGFQSSPIIKIAGRSIRVNLPGNFELPSGDYYLKIQYTESLIAFDQKKETNIELGKIGESAYWKLNRQNNTLTINGSGKLSECYPTPWKEDKDIILKLIIDNDITHISSLLFKNHLNLKSVYLNKVEEISSLSFIGCEKLKEIKFSPQIKKIGNEAFSGTNLYFIDFSDLNTLPEIGYNSFPQGAIIKVKKELLETIDQELKNRYKFIL